MIKDSINAWREFWSEFRLQSKLYQVVTLTICLGIIGFGLTVGIGLENGEGWALSVFVAFVLIGLPLMVTAIFVTWLLLTKKSG